MKNDERNMQKRSITELQVKMVNELLAGGDPQTIAQKGNITVDQLMELKDYLLENLSTDQLQSETRKKIGRNDPCPCGSGKKYKKCCLNKDGESLASTKKEIEESEKLIMEREARLGPVLNKGMQLLAAGDFQESLKFVSEAVKDFPHEDRIHDLIQLNKVYLNRPEEAEKICRNRWLEAVKDLDFVREQGFQPREQDPTHPASAGFPPVAWLAKYWVAKMAGKYKALKPKSPDQKIEDLVSELRTADDMQKFPQMKEEGLNVRREKLSPVINELIELGDSAIPYFLPHSYRYSWTAMFIPEILHGINTDLATEVLMAITMFQIPYASESSMKFLEQKGPDVIPAIKKAFAVDKEFDPIKTGLISVLGHLKTDGSFSFLMDLLNHPDRHVINWVAGALANLGNVAALPKLNAVRNRIGSEPKLDWGIEQLEIKKRADA